jgi:hypothetical protein
MTKRQRITKRVTTTTTELSNEYKSRIRLLESIKKANGRQKYRQITRASFWINKHKEIKMSTARIYYRKYKSICMEKY